MVKNSNVRDHCLSHCAEFFVNGNLHTVFSLWVVSFHFKGSNNFKSCFEGMNDPLFPYWELVNELSFSVNQYKHIQDEHTHGKKYYKRI